MTNFLHLAAGMLTTAAMLTASQAYAAPAFTVTPADMAEVESLSTITISFPEASSVTVADASLVEIMNYDTGDQPEFSVNPPLRRPEVTIQFSEPITTPGNYGLYVGSGAFLVDGEESGEIDYVYTVVEGSEGPGDEPVVTPGEIDPYEVTSINPAPGVVKSLSNWTLNFDCTWERNFDVKTAYSITCSNPDVTLPALKSRSTNIYFADDAEISEPGVYTFTVGAGMFLLGEPGAQVLNPEMSFEYVIEEGSVTKPYTGSVTIEPEEGVYDNIYVFELYFDGNVEVLNPDQVYIVCGEKTIKAQCYPDENYLAIMPLNANYALEAPGTYVLYLGEGALAIDGCPLAPLSYTYTIGQAGWNGEFTAEPQNGSVLETIKKIYITFDGANNVNVSATAGPNDFPGIFSADNDVKICGATARANSNVLSITLSKEISDPGKYYVKVPAAFFTVDGESVDKDIILDYSILAGSSDHTYTFTIDPAEGSIINPADVFTIAFEGEDLASVANDSYAWGQLAPHFSNAEGKSCPSIQIVKISDTSFVLNHSYAFSEEGEYTLVIPANYFTLTYADGSYVKNEEITSSFNVSTSGIVAVGAEDAAADVYSTTGILLIKAASAEQIQALPAGMYVVGHKKVFVK